MQKISQKLSGVPKTAVHKAKISATQKWRQSTIRALRNIEAVYKEQTPGLTRSIPSARLMPSLPESAGCSGRDQTRAEVRKPHTHQSPLLMSDKQGWISLEVRLPVIGEVKFCFTKHRVEHCAREYAQPRMCSACWRMDLTEMHCPFES